ncbi:MAG: ATP-binding protein [Holophagales bacterium]|nr:ATP-binding protein [Holophagales bacterium]
MQDPVQLSLSVAGSLTGLSRVIEEFESFSSAHGVPDPVRRSIQVVLDELLSNTVRCGKVGDREMTIEVGFHLDAETLRVEIFDDGTPFNPLERERPDTTLPLEMRPVGGLGVMLVRHLVDEITYDCEGGRNRVLLGKRLDV